MRDTLAALDDKWLGAVIDQQDFDFAAVIGIDRTWRVEDGDAMPQRQSGSRTDLPLVARWQRDGEPTRDQYPFARRDCDGLAGRHCCGNIDAGGLIRLVTRQWKTLTVG